MPRTTPILVALGALALGGTLYFTTREPAQTQESSAESSGAARVRAQAGGAEGLQPPAADASAKVEPQAPERTNADEVRLEGVMGVRGKLLPMREASELEKVAVRDLVKLHVPTPENGVAYDGSKPPPGYDADSLMIKYGSMDVAQLQEAHASVRAILDWQSRGPFVDKTAETLPNEIQRGMELELEWLEQTILYP